MLLSCMVQFVHYCVKMICLLLLIAVHAVCVQLDSIFVFVCLFVGHPYSHATIHVYDYVITLHCHDHCSLVSKLVE